ncbi:MAG: PGF-pre-PGF domain-containing protein, partial [Nanoarchaeota archaeon]
GIQANLSYTVLSANAGYLQLRLQANDTHGNENSTIWFNVTVNDTTAPVVAVNAPSNGSVVTNSVFNVSFNVTESSPASTFCSWNLTNASGGSGRANGTLTAGNANSTTSYTYNFLLSFQKAEGAYNFNVLCSDMGGSSTLGNTTFNISDGTAPTVNSKGPSSTQSTSASSVAVTVYAYTNENATCRYDDSDAAYGSLSDVFTNTGAQYHASNITYSTDQAVTLYVRCNDTNGNAMGSSAAISFSVDVNAGDGGSSGGGGGGGTTTVSPGTSSSKTQVFAQVTPSTGATMRISSDAIPITEVDVNVNEATTQVTLKVVAHSDRPGSTSKSKSSNVYKYMEITKTNLDDDNIKDASMKFKVEKSWLSANNVRKDDVALFRYVLGSWEELSTSVSSQDADNVYFKAGTPGFSVFMIAEKVGAHSEEPVAVDDAQDVVAQGDDTLDVVADTTDAGDDAGSDEDFFADESPPSKSGFWFLLAFSGLAVAALVFLFFFKGPVKPKGTKLKFEK